MASTRVGTAALVALLFGCSAPATAVSTAGDVSGPGLGPWATEFLQRERFVVVPGDAPSFSAAYAGLADSGTAVFVSSDVVLHKTAVVIDRTLASLETGDLYARLVDLSRELLRLSEEQYLLATDPLVRETARLNMAYFAVGLSLLDPDYFPSEFVRNLVERELALIEAGNTVAMSPILGPTPLDSVAGPGEDYSNYIPGGRYDDSARASRFYRAVTWYGRMAFGLPEGRVADYGLTRQALLIVRALESEAGEWLELWERIRGPLAFFYGDSGDPTVVEYMEASREVFGEEFDIESVADDTLLARFVERISGIAPAHYETHELRGMRFLVRRYLPDTRFLYRLARSDERALPTALDVVALLDSRAARTLLEEGEDAFDDEVYRNGFEEMEDELDALTYGDWTRDLNWSWLYALWSLADGPEPGAPDFAAGDAWDAKTLSTVAAGWALLRRTWIHAGRAGDQQPREGSVGGPVLVEPYPVCYERLRELVQNLRDRLLENDLLGREIASDLADHAALLSALERQARFGLERRALGGVRGDGREMETAAASSDGSLARRACTSADLTFSRTAYRDPVSGHALEVGLGRPDLIYVLRRGPEGDLVYAGAVFSFYELGLDDAPGRRGRDLSALVRGGEASRPPWVERFLVD